MRTSLIRTLADRSVSLPVATLYLTVVALPIASLLVTEGSAHIQIILLLYVAGMLYSFSNPAFGVAAAILAPLIQMSIAGTYIASAWIDARILVPPLIVGLVVRGIRSSFHARRTSDPRRTGRKLEWSVVLQAVFPVFGVFGLFSVSWSANRTATTYASMALLTAGVLFIAAAAVVPIGRVVRIISTVAVSTIGGSLLLLVIAPGWAVEQGRLRGVFENANGLAAFVVVTAPVILARMGRFRWLAALVALAVVVATGSRSGFAALALELLVLLLVRRTTASRNLVLITGYSVGVWFAWESMKGDAFFSSTIPLLRNNDSRTEVWTEGLRIFESNRWVGLGTGALPFGSTGGLATEVLATGGIVGAGIATIFLVVLLVVAFRAAAVFASVVVGGLTNALFEPWLLTGGSALCIIFWLVVCHPDSVSLDMSPARPRYVRPLTGQREDLCLDRDRSGPGPGDSQSHQVEDHLRSGVVRRDRG